MAVPKTSCEEATIRSVHDRSPCTPRQKVWILVATILGSTISFIDESVVNVALPAIERDLGASAAAAQWVVNAYTLSLSALLLIGGAAGDRFGRRLIFVSGTAGFALTSLWCGVAPDVPQLIAARITQGFAAALQVPCSLAIIGASFDEGERGKAIGTWAAFTAIAGAAGPLLGGWIVDHTTWRAIFLINPVLAVLTIAIALRHVPESRDPQAQPELDWPGALLALAGLGSTVFAIIALPTAGWRDPLVASCLVAGAILLLAFVAVEGRVRAPMMPLALFRSRVFSGVNILTLFLYAALGGAFFFLPFELIQVRGYSATLAGTTFVPFTIIMGSLSRWSGGLADRIGARIPLIVGPLVAAAGFTLLAFPPGASYWIAFILPISVLAFGLTIAVAPLTTMVINAVPTHQTGVASGINNAVASVASLLAVAVFGAVVLTSFDHALDARQRGLTLSTEARQVVEQGRGKFVIATDPGAGDQHKLATSLLRDSLADGIRVAMLMAAALALAAAGSALLTIGPQRRAPEK